MEVVRKNFKEMVPLVSDSIKKADFLAIDMEFTGLINGRDVSAFDTPEEYYLCLLKGSTEFLPIQFGLCAFQWDEKEKQYALDAYNFYLFPRDKSGQNNTFLCQSSCLDFLASQGFDFNKLIKEGISYVTEATENKMRNNLKMKQEAYSKEREKIIIPEEFKSLIEETCEKVRQFIDENKSDEMEIDRCNSFVRLLLYQELRNTFKDSVLVHTKVEDNQKRLKVTRIKSEDDTKLHETRKKDLEWEELEEAVGFSKVARLISSSEKLVVGHNMLHDVLHTVNHFFQPLPPDYKSFKELTHFMFPSLLDTKYMASLPPFKDKVNSSVLQHLLMTLSEAPFSLPKVESRAGRGYSRLEEKQHEAGYDAFITGLCFLAMQAHLSRMRGEPQPSRSLSPHSAALKPFLNKLYLSKTARQESPYMNLTGPDPTPSRDHVFHLTFPKEWQRNEINQLFSPFGPVTVYFIDDVSALVALSWRDKAQNVVRAVSKNSQLRLLPFNRYKAMLAVAGNTSMAGSTQGAMMTNNVKISNERPPVLLASWHPPKISTMTGLRQPHPPDSRNLHQFVGPPCLWAYPRCGFRNTPELKVQQTFTSNIIGTRTPKSAELPEKVVRERSNSLSSADSGQPARKRTSSGVFLIQEDEPPPKRTDIVRSNSEGSEKPKADGTANGLRIPLEVAQSEEKTKEKRKGKKKEKIIEKFDPEATTKCVSGHFKESDSWE